MSNKRMDILYNLDSYMINYLRFSRGYTVSYVRTYRKDKTEVEIQNNKTAISISIFFNGNYISYKNFMLTDGTRNEVYKLCENFIHDNVNVIERLIAEEYIKIPD